MHFEDLFFLCSQDSAGAFFIENLLSPAQEKAILGTQRYLDEAKAILGTQRYLDDAKAILGTQRYAITYAITYATR